MRRAAAAALAIALTATTAVGLLAGGGRPARADVSGVPPTVGDSFEPELGLPVTDVVAFGTSPGESPEEMWAYGQIGSEAVSVAGASFRSQSTLLEHSASSGWQVMPLPSAAGGIPAEYGALAAQSTSAGGVVLLTNQAVLVRDPGGQPRLAPAPEAIKTPSTEGEKGASSGVLAPGESLLPSDPGGGAATPPYAAIEDSGGATGVLIAPYADGGNPAGSPTTAPGVLRYDGRAWTREPIQSPAAGERDFLALALACAPAAGAEPSCWLLASVQTQTEDGSATTLLLFRRTAAGGSSSTHIWEPERMTDRFLGERSDPGAAVTVAALAQGAQMLTATGQGVWVDLRAEIGTAAGGGPSFSDVSELVAPQEPGLASSPSAATLGTWCYPTGPGCEQTSLGASLPAQYRSFAWAVPGELYGTRIVTGLDHRRMLELAGGEPGSSFTDEVGAGGDTGLAPGGAAFEPPQAGVPVQGWIADSVDPTRAPDGAGQSQVVALTTHPEPDQLQEEAVPFRRPLYALAQAPGALPAEALAVGEDGEVARYVPGAGWRPEGLYDSSGTAQTPTLRGVAWPEPGRAYAVGDNGAMWLWRSETGLWEPDPAKPFNFIGNLAAIAFSPSDPSLGYAVGEQGALLRYGKSWEQEPVCGPGVSQHCLAAELAHVNFTSIAFAGTEALATYRVLVPDPERGGELVETGGGIAVEDGAGWQPDPGATALLEALPPLQRVLSKVAGLPGGGVVAAGPGKVIERDSPNAPWHFSPQPLPEAQNISALAAYRDPSGSARAIVSVDLDEYLNPANSLAGTTLENGPSGGDISPPTASGQPTEFLSPDPPPSSGYLLKETADGWSDMEHLALPAPRGQLPLDMPARPDPVLALVASANGETGLAVGGETGDFEGRALDAAYQTAAAMRFPAGQAAPNGTTPAPIATTPGSVSFAVGGQATCARECAAFANDSLGPNVWLEHALQTASSIEAHSPGGLRAFLYAGSDGGESVFAQDVSAFAGSLPAYAAGSAGAGPGAIPGPAGTNAYSFVSEGAGGPVEVNALAFVEGALENEAAQLTWLAQQLIQAKAASMPAIAVGNAALGARLPDENSLSQDQTVVAANPVAAAALSQLLVQDGASAYFFDYPGSDMQTTIRFGGGSIPAYGTGTLGYVRPPLEAFEADSLGSSGFLLAEVDAAARDASTNVAPVSVRIVPNIAQLALDATNGTQLRRSQVALFEALARRPLGGAAIKEGAVARVELSGSAPYDQIPRNCQGASCAYEVPTEYTFSSSNPDIGDFVAHEAASRDPLQVELGANKLPVPDPHSGLFCPFNEGTTTVSITTGGLTYSEPVTVLGGSVEYPCGTVPLKNPPARPARVGAAFAIPSLAPSNPPPVNPTVQTLPPPAPPPAPVKSPPPTRHVPPPAPFLFQPLLPAALVVPLAIVPPISPPVARPIPPGGTAPVSQGASAPERQREREAAGELASNKFSAYDPNEAGWMGPSIVALVLLAAGAGVGIRGGVRRRRQLPALARARTAPQSREGRAQPPVASGSVSAGRALGPV